MGFYLRCRRLQSGAAAQADSGGLLMDKLPRFAKVFADRRRIVEMDISLRLRNLAEFFNSLLIRPDAVAGVPCCRSRHPRPPCCRWRPSRRCFFFVPPPRWGGGRG